MMKDFLESQKEIEMFEKQQQLKNKKRQRAEEGEGEGKGEEEEEEDEEEGDPMNHAPWSTSTGLNDDLLFWRKSE